MAHQFWISYHPPTGAKHGSSGDETPPIPEEELEQQKIEHERQMQKEKICQAIEAEQVAQLDINLLHQRAIEAQEEQEREKAEHLQELRGLKSSWSHHSRLCDLQHQAAHWRYSRPSISDTTRPSRENICQAIEAEQGVQVDNNLLHQKAIEAKEKQDREKAEHLQELRGLKSSWSHHSRLSDLQHQAAHWRYSRPSISDTTRPSRQSVISEPTSGHLMMPTSNESDTNDGFENVTQRRGLIVYVISCGGTKKPLPKPPDANPPPWFNILCKKCPRIYLPVCGSDGKTYTNECRMNCLNYELVKDPQVKLERQGICDVYP